MRFGVYAETQCPPEKSHYDLTLCHPLPLHNPLILAGGITAADLLTHGRVECRLGRGHAWLFPQPGIRLGESRARYEEALDLLTLAWTQEHSSYAGRYLRQFLHRGSRAIKKSVPNGATRLTSTSLGSSIWMKTNGRSGQKPNSTCAIS
jgi:alkanesulfonate monooxygenase SsuD/methylene tetrahydromethanopterin reductase-like flavin-dependent oxidoreductase (luciferase family)